MVPCDYLKAFVRLRDKEVLQSIFHPFSIAASPALWVAAAWGRRIQLSNHPTLQLRMIQPPIIRPTHTSLH